MWVHELVKKHSLVYKEGEFSMIPGRAVFDEQYTQRYFLEKKWGIGDKYFTAFMMNPSKASHIKSDATVNQMINLAKKHECDGLQVINASSIIEGSANNLNRSAFSRNEVNWDFIQEAVKKSHILFLSWGLKSQLAFTEQSKQDSTLLSLFISQLHKIYCYEIIQSTDKNYKKNAPYFFPHPRPRGGFNRYTDHPIQRITNEDLLKTFKIGHG